MMHAAKYPHCEVYGLLLGIAKQNQRRLWFSKMSLLEEMQAAITAVTDGADAGDANAQILLSPGNNDNTKMKKKRKRNPSKEKEKIFRKKQATGKLFLVDSVGSIQDLFLFAIKLPESYF